MLRPLSSFLTMGVFFDLKNRVHTPDYWLILPIPREWAKSSYECPKQCKNAPESTTIQLRCPRMTSLFLIDLRIARTHYGLCESVKIFTNWVRFSHESKYLSKKLLTIDERGSKIARNRVFDCHLSPIGRHMAIENSVYNIFWSTFVYSINVFDCAVSSVPDRYWSSFTMLTGRSKRFHLIFLTSAVFITKPKRVKFTN